MKSSYIRASEVDDDESRASVEDGRVEGDVYLGASRNGHGSECCIHKGGDGRDGLKRKEQGSTLR